MSGLRSGKAPTVDNRLEKDRAAPPQDGSTLKLLHSSVPFHKLASSLFGQFGLGFLLLVDKSICISQLLPFCTPITIK